MPIKDDKNSLILAWAWVLGFTLFRLIYATLFPLAPDEANYWQWSRHLDWGYHDQSPMIAWAIRSSTYWWSSDAMAEKVPVKTFFLYRAYGFKGGMRWIPPPSYDTRAGSRR